MPASFVWQPGPTGGTPTNAANLNRLALTADIGSAGTPTGDALRAAFVAHGAASIDLCSAPYNATVGADITTALQTALNWIAANCPNGGEVYFSQPGQYLINGAPQTGTAQGYTYSGQILIPAVSLAGSMPIRIRGAFPSSGGGQSTGAPNGVILRSNATAGYVFDIQPGFTEFGCPWTGVMPIFENLVIRCADNPTAGGINLLCTQRARLSRVQIDTPTSWVAPVAGALAALVMPQVYNNGDITVRDCTIRGYPTGVVLSEHGVFDNLDIAYCLTAFKGNGASHVNWFGYVDIEECPTMFAGGNAPTFGAPAIPAGSNLAGMVDYENGKAAGDPLAPVAFINDSATNPITGKLDVWAATSGSLPVIGGRSLDVVPLTQAPTLGPKMRGAGWMETHPYDNFLRQVALSGAGAPGQCSSTLHPWRVDSGSFSVSGQALKGLTASNYCFVPCLKAAQWGGVSRTLTMTFTLGATSPQVQLIASAVVSGTGTSVNGGNTGIIAKCVGGQQVQLRIGNQLIAAGGANLTTGVAHTVKMAVYHNALGYPMAVKVYLDGTLIITSGIKAGAASLGGVGPSTWPYYEDGIGIFDTASSVSLFAVQDITVDPPYVASGTATLVAGTATITDNGITASSRVRVFNQAAGGTVGSLSVTLTAGTGFTINSTSTTDTSSVYWELVSY